MQLSASSFKVNDIRGIVGQTFTTEFAEHLGLAFGREALIRGERAVAVGRDGCLSGPVLQGALMRGLNAAGIDVSDLGAVTTPMLYYAVGTRAQAGCCSGIQVTGSYCSTEHDNFKLVSGGEAVSGAAIERLRQRMETLAHTPATSGKMGFIRPLEVLAEYSQRIAGDCRLTRPLTVVVDCGNGVAGESAPGILRAQGCDVYELYSDVDGSFPNHRPDPSRAENLVDLIEMVKLTRADLGLAFDGDGDRLGVVTAQGEIISPDRQLMMFAQDVLARRPGAAILHDANCSPRLPAAIRAAGGVPMLLKTGDSPIESQLLATKASLAGDMNGHICFGKRWYGFADATYAAARLLEILSRHANPSRILRDLPASQIAPMRNAPVPASPPLEREARMADRGESLATAC